MANYLVATLSSSIGWITDSVEEALDKHFLYYFTSRRSQGKVITNTPSFYYVLSEHGTSQDSLISALRESFSEYLSELFPNNEVGVTAHSESSRDGKYGLSLTAKVVHEDKAYDLTKSILINGESYKVLDKYRLNK